MSVSAPDEVLLMLPHSLLVRMSVFIGHALEDLDSFMLILHHLVSKGLDGIVSETEFLLVPLTFKLLAA